MEIYNDSYCVYIHTNKTNGKMYVGQTSQKPEYRWDNGKRYCHNQYFYRAIQKYGWDGFDHDVIASGLTKDEADHFEELLIKELNTTSRDNGYNIMFGGNNHKHSEETKQKMSKTRTGKKHSDDWCKNISNGLKGKKDINKKALEAHRKKVKCVETNVTYDSQVEAEEKTGISRKGISACCRGYQQTAGGYHWEEVA